MSTAAAAPKTRREIRIWQKLALMVALLAVPLGLVTYLYVGSQNRFVEFALKEQEGLALLRPAKTALTNMLDHRILSRLPGRASDADARASQVDRALNEMADLDAATHARFSQGAERSTDGLAARAKQAWAVARGGPKADPDGAKADAAYAAVREYVALVGDTSNLILDPDLDSYYLMDSVLLKLPDGLGLTRDLFLAAEGAIRAGKSLPPAARSDVLVRLGLLKSNLAGLQSETSGMPVSFKPVNDSTPDKSLGRLLQPTLSEHATEAAALLTLVESDLVSAETPTLAATPAAEATMKSVRATFRLWDAAATQLNGLITKRVAGFRASTTTALSLAGLSLIGSLVLVVFIARGFTRQIGAMRTMFDEFAQGNYRTRTAVVSNDELGGMAVTLNERILPLVQSRDERNAIQGSIMKLLEEVSGVADGDLTKEAEVTADVTGAIADSFNYMLAQLRDIIGNVQSTTQRVSASAAQVTHSAEELATGVVTQAERINETSTGLDQMATSIRQVSQEAAKSAEVARESLATARRGTGAVRDTIDGMDRIREQVQETAKRMKRLGESSQEIGQIVQLIEDIADRTSILALNASIQAAMAGDAGRGFAVVAEEVERLSVRSAEATRQIGTLIRNIQAEAGEAVSAMERGIQEVVGGTKLANQAGQVLEDIQSVSDRLAGLIGGIADLAQREAKHSDGLAGTMRQLSEQTEATAVGTRQAARSVGELAGLAQSLRQSVAAFKLPGGAA